MERDADRTDPARGEGRRPRARRAALAALLLALAAAVLWGAQREAERRLLGTLEARAASALKLHVEIVRGWLGRFRPLASIYARNPEIARLLRAPDDPLQLDLVNQRLEAWTSASGAADTYVLDRDGIAVAASNSCLLSRPRLAGWR